MKFKIGTKVTIRKDSQYFDEAGQLPPGVVGIVERKSISKGWVIVKWKNGQNSYGPEDLDFYPKSNNPK